MLRLKDEVFEKFKQWKAMAERFTGKELQVLRTDNGGKYTLTEFSCYLRKEGIKHELTVSKTLQQNGVVERMNRTIGETACWQRRNFHACSGQKQCRQQST